MKYILKRKKCRFSLKWNKLKIIYVSNKSLHTAVWISIGKSSLIFKKIISSYIYTIYVSSKLAKICW